MENLKELKQSVNIADIIGPRLQGGLKRKGKDLLGLCCFHDENTPSFSVNEHKQIFKCFGCGEAGDVFDFLTRYGSTLKEAIEIVKGVNPGYIKEHTPKDFIPKNNQVTWKQINPVPTTAPMPNFTHYQLGEPSHKFAYRNIEGQIIGYILRYQVTKKEKTHRPLTFCTDGTRLDWRWQGFDNPKPLYNLPDFKAKPNHAVLIVEGEKTADAAKYLFQGKKVVTTWQFGAQGSKHVDFSPLEGRDVFLWPDNDISQKYGKGHPNAGEIKAWHEQPGNHAMLEIYEQIKGIAKSVKWVKNSPNFADKWDIADVVSIWTEEEAKKYLKDNTISVPGTEKKDTTVKPPPPAKNNNTAAGKNKKFPYKILGFETQDSGPPKYWFFSYATNSAVSLKPEQMKDINLTSIANLNYWTKEFPGRKDGIDIKGLVDFLTDSAHKVGVYSLDDQRGRGAWLDNGKIVIHAGSHLIVDGKKTSFEHFQTNYVYEQRRVLDVDLSRHLELAKAKDILDICKMLNWDRTQNALLLAGWIVIAPICGVLNWRPHIWITGPSGGGKSTIMHQIIKPMIKNVAVTFQASTTEPGVRQRLKNDAIPVLFDEVDADDKEDQRRIQAILGLMRASSTSDGGEIAKGTSGQVVRTFVTKTCFCFSSIGLQVSAQQDRSRVTILGLKENENKPEKFAELLRKITAVITDDYAKQLQARTILNLPTLLVNINMFSKAATIVLGRQRTGDQLGPLLAGAYSLEHEGEITLDEALAIVTQAGFSWSEEVGLELSKDEFLLLQCLMEQIVFLENADGIGKIERNIGELILCAVKHTASDDELSPSKAEDRLKRIGIMVDQNYITISNSSIHIKKYLENTAWGKNHNKILMRLDGSVALDSTMFTTELRTRAVKVPLGHVSTRKEIIPKSPQEVAKMSNNPPPLKDTTDPGAIIPIPDEDLPF